MAFRPIILGKNSLYVICWFIAPIILLPSWNNLSSPQCGFSWRKLSIEFCHFHFVYLTLWSSPAILLCSLRKMVCMAARAGCSLALSSPATKHLPDSALHSLFFVVVGIKFFPLPCDGRVMFSLPFVNSLRLSAEQIFCPYIWLESKNAVFWFSCSLGPARYHLKTKSWFKFFIPSLCWPGRDLVKAMQWGRPDEMFKAGKYGSLRGTGIGQHSGWTVWEESQALQSRMISRTPLLTGVRVMSWSRNCPNCINIRV